MRPALKLALTGEAIALAALLLLAADQLAHKRVQGMAGVNTWGYRGAVLPTKAAGEIRVAVIGGDYGFGWGVAPRETTAAYLATVLENRLSAAGNQERVTAVNLGALGLPAAAYAARIAGFAYLAPDVICLYIDLTDRDEGATLPPVDSVVTALTGYVPMLPLLLRDKGQAMTMTGNELAGSAVSAVGSMLRRADRAMSSWVPRSVPTPATRREALDRAVDAALSSTAAVVAVVPMPVEASEWPAHAEAIGVFQQRAASEPRLRSVDLAGVARMSDPQLRLDGHSLGAAGQSLVAEAIAPAVWAAIESTGVVRRPGADPR